MKPPLDDDPGFRYGFEIMATLPLTQGVPAVPNDTTMTLLVLHHIVGILGISTCSFHPNLETYIL